jgi:hypothetical protein
MHALFIKIRENEPENGSFSRILTVEEVLNFKRLFALLYLRRRLSASFVRR